MLVENSFTFTAVIDAISVANIGHLLTNTEFKEY